MKVRVERPSFASTIAERLQNKLIVSEHALERQDLSQSCQRQHIVGHLKTLINWSTDDWNARNAILNGNYSEDLDWSDFVGDHKQLTDRGCLAGWAEVGFPIFEGCDDRYAASLMCTSIKGISLEELDVPGATLIFTLPQTEMIPSFMAILAIRASDAYMFEVYFPGSTNLMMAGSVTELLFADPDRSLDDSDKKALSLVKNQDFESIKYGEPRLGTLKEQTQFDFVRNYVAGLLLASQTKSNHTYEGLALSRAKKLRGFDPRHRVAILGHKTKTDMRSAVKRYISDDTHKGLSFQFIVRGHYRDQACGPKQSLRKVTWIQPYWKGPEEAIIHARAVRFQNPLDLEPEKVELPTATE